MADVTATWHWYPYALMNLMKGTDGNFGTSKGVSATLKVALYHSNSNAAASYEVLRERAGTRSATNAVLTGTVSGGNYADGTCAGITATVNKSGDKVELQFNDSITFGTTVTASAKFAVLYKDNTNDTVVAYMTFPSVISAESGSITMNQNDAANAALTITYS